MDDLMRLLDWLSPGQNQHDTADGGDPIKAIATVINTRGSAYRRPGARMVIRQSLAVQGAVSAGCLERDIVAHCESLNSSDRPLLLTYDGSSSDELIFGLKLGCDGIVQVLVEPHTGANFNRLRLLVPRLLAEHSRLVAITVFDMNGPNAVAPVGLVMLETGTQTYELASLPRPVANLLRAEGQQLLQNKKDARSYVLQQEVDGYTVSALVELVQPITSILVIGGGQDVAPLVEMADILGWRTTVVNDTNYDRLPAIIEKEYITAAIVMTHDYVRDGKILQTLFSGKKQLDYIGIVGPRRRADKLVAELALAGLPLTDEKLSTLYSPVGLDIGAERPEEIALSILAEVRAVLSNHSGGSLRCKQGPIHEPTLQKVSLATVSAAAPLAVSASGAVDKQVLQAFCPVPDSNYDSSHGKS